MKSLIAFVAIATIMFSLTSPALAHEPARPERVTLRCSDPEVCKELAHLFVPPPAPPVTETTPTQVKEESPWRALFHYTLGAGGGAAVGAAGYTVAVLASEKKELDVGALVGITVGSAVVGVVLTTLLREF